MNSVVLPLATQLKSSFLLLPGQLAQSHADRGGMGSQLLLTLFFSRSRSFRVSVSAFAMTGTIFTLLCIAFINATSKGFNLKTMFKSHTFREYSTIFFPQNHLTAYITTCRFPW